MDLRPTWVGKKGAAFVCPPDGGRVTSHCQRRQVVDLAKPARGKNDGMRGLALHRACIHITRDNSARLAIDHDQVKKFMPREKLHRTSFHLAHERLVGAKQELLSGLPSGIESPGNLD